TLQTGTPLDADGRAAPGVPGHPGGEIAAGTPLPARGAGAALAPAVAPAAGGPGPTLPLPLPPAPVRLVDGGKDFEVQLVDAEGRKGSWVSPLQGGIPDQAYRNPGYPFFVPGLAGPPPPAPPRSSPRAAPPPPPPPRRSPPPTPARTPACVPPPPPPAIRGTSR